MSRTGARLAAAVTCMVAGAALLPGCTSSPAAHGDRPPNIVVFLTDDQSMDTLPHSPPTMPYLEARMRDPNDHWIRFTNAFISSPMCCPSRATLLTGQYAHHTGVTNNPLGYRLDESSTVATWLRDAGYRTGLFGKYLNGYPFDRGPYVPPGWDRWVAKEQGPQDSEYYGYVLVEDGVRIPFGTEASEYLTDVLAQQAVDFVRGSAGDSPFLLWFAPTTPHFPWTPSPRYRGSFDGVPVHDPPSVGERDVSDKPAWVRALPALSRQARAQLDRDRRREYEMMRSADDALRRIVEALRATGRLDDTVIFFLTDNGFSFGEHRFVSKPCPYEECIHTPFLVRYPGARPHDDPHLLSNVDLAPTIAELANERASQADGTSLVSLLEDRSPRSWRTGALIEWAGGNGVPPFVGVRTTDFLYVEYGDGEHELYDLTGRFGPPDPFELRNVADDPAYRGARDGAAAILRRLSDVGPDG